MAAVLVGRALLSATLQVVFDRLASSEVLDYLRGKKVSKELIDNLKFVLLAVNAVLDDAEKKQITNRNIKRWLDELEAASFDAEDLLDEIATQANLEDSGSRKSRTSKFFNCISIPRRSYNQDMKNELQKILTRFKAFQESIRILGLTEKGVGEKPTPRQPTTSLVDESVIYGRDGDKKAIIKLLIKDDHEGSNEVCVIPIVGLGGIGKTTLAQSLYSHHAVEEHFNFKSWVCVSEEFEIYKVTKTVLCAVTNSPSHSYDNEDLDSLQTKLKEKLVGKKFLIVLDDVWNENYVNWENLSKPFKHGVHGSKILVTTRNENVARIMQTVPPHSLGQLNDEDCWQLFSKHAFGNRDCNAYPDLVTIGRKVVKKCGGLPLAAKTLGGLLRSRVGAAEWERISESEIWDLPYDKSNILPALMLSYHYLPSPLKRCFAFCSVFPKDYEFDRHQLVSLWMAENLLLQTTTNKRVEDVGDEYFNELDVGDEYFNELDVGDEYFNELLSLSFFQKYEGDFGYSFFQRLSNSQESYFVMHDLVHDLSKFLSRGCCFTVEDGISNEDVMKVRHLAVAPDVSLQRFGSISKAIHLRTLLPLYRYSFRSLSNEVVNTVILKLRRLRILSLFRCENLEQLNESIGDQLKHLRFLDLSETSIIRLPNSVSMLYNLQTLNLSGCLRLIELPENMCHLINLRHLDISGCSNLKKMPRQISDLKSLQRLSTFIVGEDKGTKIEELRNFSDLHGDLSLKNLENVASAADASEARLTNKKHLEGLHLSCGPLAFFPLDLIPNLSSLYISECKNLKSVGVSSDGDGLQKSHSLTSLLKIDIQSCPNFISFLKGGLQAPNLTALSTKLKKLPEQMHNLFPSLQELNISDCPEVESDTEGGLPSNLTDLCVFNCPRLIAQLMKWNLPSTLSYLSIGGCPHLKRLDMNGLQNLTSLKTLYILRCPQLEKLPQQGLPTSVERLNIAGCPLLEKRCQRETGEDWNIISHIPQILIDYQLI